MPDYPSINSARSGAGRFATTHWSVVLAAGQPESTRYQQALEALCRTYWFPLYAYLRRHGCNSHEAQDYTQAFFTALLDKGGLGLAEGIDKSDPRQFFNGSFDDLERHGCSAVGDNLKAGQVGIIKPRIIQHPF